MGDVLGSVFGSAKNTDATQTPDPQAQAANRLKLEQLQTLFGGTPYAGFGQPSDAYTPSPNVSSLYNDIGLQSFQLPSDIGLGNLQLADTPNVNTSNLMSLADYSKLGLDSTSNYISKIATPEIMSQLALAGLESSGASADAIAKATAQIGLPFVQSLPGASNTLTQAGPQANLTQAQANLTGGQRQLLPFQALLSNTQANMTNAQRSLIPNQAGVMNAQRASTLFPMADYGRTLQESDLLRRQGVVTTGLTGLPFTPGSTTQQKQSSPPMFGWFGQG